MGVANVGSSSLGRQVTYDAFKFSPHPRLQETEKKKSPDGRKTTQGSGTVSLSPDLTPCRNTDRGNELQTRHL